MNRFAQIMTFVILTLSAAFAAVSATLYSQRRNWRQKWEKAQAELTSVTKQKNQEVDALKKQNQDLLDAKTQVQADNRTLQGKLASTIATIKRQEAQVASLESTRLSLQATNKDLLAQLGQEKKETQRLNAVKAKLDKDLKAARDGALKLQANIEALKSKKTDLEVALADTEKKLTSTEEERGQLETLVKRATDIGVDFDRIPTRTISGQVIKAVGGIVVINRGKNHGVGVGTQLTVYRGDNFIAKIMVGDARADMSTATVVPGITSGKSILAGDNVTNTIR